jgi:hypothetical protein
MEGRLFTFLGAIGGHGQEWIILSHYILVLGIIFLIARAATRKLQLVSNWCAKRNGNICWWYHQNGN